MGILVIDSGEKGVRKEFACIAAPAVSVPLYLNANCVWIVFQDSLYVTLDFKGPIALS